MKPNPDQVSLNIFDQIDAICREYRSLWKQGKRPKLEQWFDQVPGNAQAQLFLNLLETEMAFRRRASESPTSDEYLKRFSQFARQVRQAFDEQTQMSVDDLDGVPLDSAADDQRTRTLAHPHPSANRLGDYELIRELGRGGMGVVYEARHMKTGNRVALKTLPTGQGGQEVNAERLHRFRKEFRSLSEINHPHLVGMQTLEVDGAQWFFTMDLIEGEDFLSYVRPRNVVDEERLRGALKQLAQGIMALHQRGIIHRDLKPSNVLVEHDGRVAILDFGLVAELQKVTDVTQTRSGMFAGTPRYAAPEQMFGQRSEASDWYALGVMLYEGLTGELPFTAKNPMELLRQKQEQDPPSLSSRDDLPSDLIELVDGLLKRVPSERLGSAAIGARLQLESETRAYGSSGTAGSTGSSGSVADEEDPNFLEPQEEENVLIGREEQLAQLEAAQQELLATRQPVVVWVTGLSGEGKSSLVEKFLRPLRRGTEMLVLSGRCYDRESVPFKAVDCIIEPLVSFLRATKSEQVRAWLPDDISMLAHLFPLLRRVSLIDDRCGIRPLAIDSKQIRYRAFAALRDLLVSISQTLPVVLFVDDLQWGDADSAEAMFDLLQPPGAPVVQFLGSYRRDEAADSPFLNEWHKRQQGKPSAQSARTVEVHPLTPEQCLTLVALRVGVEPDRLRRQADALFQDTHGNPYFLEQLIEGFDPVAGSFRAVPLQEIIAAKLKRLPSDAAALLDVIAVAGKAVSLAEASEVAGQSKPAFGTITHMRSERLVRLIGSGDQQLVDTYHDKIRETLYTTIDWILRQKIHLTFGETIERQLSGTRPEVVSDIANDASTLDAISIDPRVPDLAFHFLNSGDSPRAFKYNLRAGRQSMAAFAFSDAVTYLEHAKQLEPSNLSESVRFMLSFSLGKALSGVGRFGECIDQLEQSADLAPSAFDRSAANFALAESRYRISDYYGAVESYRRAFADVGERLPRTLAGKLLGTAANLISIHLIPAPLLRILNRNRHAQMATLAQMYPRFVQLIMMLDMYMMVYGITRPVALAKSQDDDIAKATAYGWYAAVLSLSGAVGLCHWMASIGRRFAKGTISLQSKGEMHHHDGIFWYCRGKLSQSENALLQAEYLLGRVNDWRLSMDIHILRHLWSVRGHSMKIAEYANKELLAATISNDEITIAYGKYGLADALSRQGQFDEAIALAQEAVQTLDKWNGTFKCIAYQELGRVQLQSSQYSEARKTLTHAVGLVFRLRFFEISVPSFPLLSEAILGTNWTSTSISISRRDRKQAMRMAWLARLTGWLFPNNTAHALRVSGRAAKAAGKTRRALKFFDKAIAAATKIGADYELARSLIDKSMLDHPNAAADRERGLKLLAELGCVLPVAEQAYLGITMQKPSPHDPKSKAECDEDDQRETPLPSPRRGEKGRG